MRVVGVDIGGTFTDLVEVDDTTGDYRYHKLASTPDDPARAFLDGSAELTAERDPPDRLIHGSTVATNTLIQRAGARTALMTTRGHRDVLEIARGVKPYEHIFHLAWVKPEPLVPRYLRVDVTERLDAGGRVVEPLDEDEVALACEFLAEHDVEALAVCFLFAYVDDVHERRAAEIAAARLPGVPISLSSRILPQWREYERTSTTVADAFIKPVMSRYLDRLGAGDQGSDRHLFIMKSNGGVTLAASAAETPIETYLSGPAAGVVAGRAIGLAAGCENLIVGDMGGTSFDVSLVAGGEVEVTTEAEAAPGIPLRLSMLDVRAIGAGGGSIAWIDSGGGLRVGPRSAAADPGPACYGRGGSEPTVTDANLVLGRLGVDSFLGGRFTLDEAAASSALRRRVAVPLGLDVQAAALGVIDVTVANMAREIRTITAERGIDPRDFALVAGGGAGPLHAVAIAEELGVTTVLVPPYPGLLSAIGLVLSDLKLDSIRSLPLRLERDGAAPVAAYVEELVQAGTARLRSEGYTGVPDARVSLDMRYLGQNWEIEVPVDRSRLEVGSITRSFDQEHRRLYSFDMPEHEHELINVRVSVSGRLERGADHLPRRSAASSKRAGERGVFDRSTGRVEPASILDRDALAAGDIAVGPTVIEELDSTVYLPATWRARVDDLGTLVLSPRS
ncbi:MAG: hydantoinase/oxoprolinase family protein [Gaiellales bacterium]